MLQEERVQEVVVTSVQKRLASATRLLAMAIVMLPVVVSAQPKPPLRIGVLEDMNGPYATLTGPAQVIAAQLAVDDFGGKVLGRPIEIVSADHTNKPDVGSAIARRWFDTENVSMIAGLGNSAIAFAVQGVAASKGRIDIVTSAGAADLTGKACSSTGFHWAFDTSATSKVVSSMITRLGGKTWYYIAADYTFGAALQSTSTQYVESLGGTVVGSSKLPLGTPDFGAALVAAQASGAQVIGLANGGEDTENAIKQANEFGLVTQGRKLAALSMYITDVHSLGKSAQGLYFAESFYWDMDDASRAWAKRFFAKAHYMPNMLQAGVYGAVLHYLKAMQKAGTDDSATVAKLMHQLPVNDFYTHDAKIREDGLVVRPMYLLQVHQEGEPHGEWDLLKVVQAVPGEEAYPPASESACNLMPKIAQ
jgi:branched-chain amino acid transport system substrate-binding protein